MKKFVLVPLCLNKLGTIDEWGHWIYENFNLIPVEPLQHAYWRSGLRSAQAAWNVGWLHAINQAPDSSRFLRSIGLRPLRAGVFRETVPYDLAIKILEALHYDPSEYGL